MGALIDRLIAASLRHRAVVVGATILLAVAGLWSFATLNTDAFPDLTPNQVLVMIEVPGLSPAEVEQQVTYPMEVFMQAEDGIRDYKVTGVQTCALPI